ncbi:hypothetical protein LTR05_003906 [Lithohypha guttulata]|uniref:Heterokaryon incompatibility domain-containing protein n=1 Tax=Lithohypha guttulata TaxID=1690604 RepID=A0AAN7T2L7_9EURO|nr:hypothetical protein LTR05_003906 [Lithohypha guttulata]
MDEMNPRLSDQPASQPSQSSTRPGIPSDALTDIQFSERGSAITNARQAVDVDGQVRWLTRDGPGEIVDATEDEQNISAGNGEALPVHDNERLVRDFVDSVCDRHGFPKGQWRPDFEGGTPRFDPQKEWLAALVRNFVPTDELANVDLANPRDVAAILSDAMNKAPTDHSYAFGMDGHIDYDCYNQGPELDPRTQRTFSNYLGMLNQDRNLGQPTARQRGLDRMFKHLASEDGEFARAARRSSTASSASSDSNISISHLDDKSGLLECDQECWLRSLDTTPLIDEMQAHNVEDTDLQPFQYEPLSQTQFRLLELQPSDKKTELVRCSIMAAPLPKADVHDSVASQGKYEALSYTWGSQNNLRTISLNSRAFHVTVNLHDALLSLRDKAEPRMLWIDAVCINQTDDEEKSRQVQHMKTIYEEASSVVVWLGDEAESSGLAISTMRILDDERSRELTFKRSHPTACMLNLQKIYFAQLAMYRRPYFRRTWVRQEVSSAKHIVVHCGKDIFSWNLLRRSEKRLPRTGRKLDYADIEITADHNVESYSVNFLESFKWLENGWLPGKALLQTFGDIRSLWYYHSGGLLELLMAGRAYEATNPRDKIYAVLGMAEVPLKAGKLDKLIIGNQIQETAANPAQADGDLANTNDDGNPDEEADMLIVDYSASVSAIYQYLAKYMINRDRNLDILCIISTHRNKDSADLPTWTPDWRVPTSDIGMKECFDYFTEKFGASGSTEAVPQHYDLPGVLFVEAIYFDDVGALGEATTSARHMFSYLTDGQILAQKFDEQTHLRRCAQTEAEGLPCLVPRAAKIGDGIFILLGAKLPFVLRKLESGHSRLSEYPESERMLSGFPHQYEVVGPCCVPAYMYGNLIKVAKESGCQPANIVLL